MSLTFSSTIGKISAAIAAAQLEMEGAKKTSNNPAFGSKYADLGEVIEAIKVFAKHEIAVTQHPGGRTDRYEGGEGTVLVPYVSITTLLSHSSGEWMHSTVEMPVGGKKDAHAHGGGLTYLKRYGAAAIGLVPTEDDDGNSNVPLDEKKTAAPSKPKSLTPAPPSPELYNVLINDLKLKGKDTEALVKQIAANADAKQLKTGTQERLAFVIDELKKEAA